MKFVEGVERVVELLDVARADERGGDALVAKHPGDGHLREGLAAAGGDVVQGTDALEIFFAEKFLEKGVLRRWRASAPERP